MRGWTSDFTPYEPAARAAGRILPPDFDTDRADAYLDAPLAPEVLECERCDPRACHALLKQGRTLKPDCAAFLIADADARVAAPNIAEQVVATLKEHGPQTMQDLVARLNIKYFSLRHHITQLLGAERIVCVGDRPRRAGHGGVGAKVYGLPTAAQPAVARAVREARPERRAATAQLVADSRARVLELLRDCGPLAVRDLATLTGLTAATTHDRLRALETAGAVRQAGTETRIATEFHNRRYKVQLWAATEDDHE